MDMAEKVRENRLRRMAERQGLMLRKVRRHDPRAWDYGLYWLVDPRTTLVLQMAALDGKLTIDQVEAYLKGDSEGEADDMRFADENEGDGTP
jgi:hypothetical protein